MSPSLYVSVQYEGDIDITEDILYETELYCNILKYGLLNKASIKIIKKWSIYIYIKTSKIKHLHPYKNIKIKGLEQEQEQEYSLKQSYPTTLQSLSKI
jgi:hypothetical protein